MATKRVLVYGGKGALGSACVKLFKSKNYVSVVTAICMRMWAHLYCYSDSVTETLHSIRRIRSDKSQHHQLKANAVEVLPASPRLIVTFSPPYAVIDFVFRLRFSIRLAHIQPESNGIAVCLAILCICGSRNSVRALHLLSCGIHFTAGCSRLFFGGGGGGEYWDVFPSVSSSAKICGHTWQGFCCCCHFRNRTCFELPSVKAGQK